MIADAYHKYKKCHGARSAQHSDRHSSRSDSPPSPLHALHVPQQQLNEHSTHGVV